MLPDRLAPDLMILFCGTAASHRSAERGAYYAGPGNRFWSLLAETGLTTRQLLPEDDVTLPILGFGLTDLAKGVSGMDRDIARGNYLPERLAGLVAIWKPRALAFTSLTAARLALRDPRLAAGRLKASPFAGTEVWILPSPSGAARGTFRIGPWQDLADWASWMKGGQR